MPAVVINAAPIFKRENYLSLKPRAQVAVRFGRPLAPPAAPDDSRALRIYIRQVMQAMAELRPEELQVAMRRREQAEQLFVQPTGPQPGEYPGAPAEDV